MLQFILILFILPEVFLLSEYDLTRTFLHVLQSNNLSFLQEYTCPRCDSGFIEELLEERRCVSFNSTISYCYDTLYLCVPCSFEHETNTNKRVRVQENNTKLKTAINLTG